MDSARTSIPERPRPPHQQQRPNPDHTPNHEKPVKSISGWLSDLKGGLVCWCGRNVIRTVTIVVSVWVCMTSAVITTRPGRGGSSSSLRAGISLDWSATFCWARIMPLDLVRRGPEVRSRILIGAGAAHGAVHRDDCSSFDGVGVRAEVQNYDPRWTSRSAGSRSWSIRRIVDSDGRACPTGRPRDPRSDEVRSVVCSYIAVRLRQPVSPPAMFRDRIVNRSWRTTHLSLGPGHVLENLGQGLA